MQGRIFTKIEKIQKDLQRRDDNVILVGFSTSLISDTHRIMNSEDFRLE